MKERSLAENACSSDVVKLLNQIRTNILERQLLRSGERIVVAVSGGVDSIVLLHVMNSLAREMRWDLTVAHLNHQLRGRSSDADARFVETFSQRLGLRYSGSVAEVQTIARQNRISLEMAGRQARHAFFKQAALENNCTAIALAHHADDQLELFFLRLLRGSGDGLGGMHWISPLPNHPRLKLIRPLLDLPKEDLKEYAAATGLTFREDASNADLDFQRNRIRHELLPLLRKNYQSGLNAVISRIMDILSAKADCVSEIARQWMKSRRPKFSSLPVAVQRHVLQNQLYAAGIAPDFTQVESLRSFPHRSINLRKEQRYGSIMAIEPGGSPGPFTTGEATVARDGRGMIYFLTPLLESQIEPDFELQIELGLWGEKELEKSSLRWHVESRRGTKTLPNPAVQGTLECFDADKLGERIFLRHWRPGDRFQPIGMAQPVKLQDLLTNAKIPRNRRHMLVLATTDRGDIFWVENLRISELFKLTPETRRRLVWQWKRS